MNGVHFMSEKSDWETPQELFDKLHEEFHFTLDAAASDHNHKLPRYYTESTDGLSQDWGGSVCSATHLTVLKKLAYGLKSVGGKLRSRILWLFCLSLPEQIASPSTIFCTINPMSTFVFSKAVYGLKITDKRWEPHLSPRCCVSSMRI